MATNYRHCLVSIGWAILLTLVVTVCAPMVLARTGPVGIVKNPTGSVYIFRGGERLMAEPGMSLMENDRLVTGNKSFAGIIFTDGTMVTLGPKSDMDITAYTFEPESDAYQFDLYMKKGTGLYQTGKITRLAPQVLNVRTPRATVGVRGTRFIIDVK